MGGSSLAMKASHNVLILGVMVCLALAVWFIPRSPFLSGLIEYTHPGIIPASSWANNLDSSDTDLVRESLFFLTGRKDPVGVSKAIELLNNSDDYIWLNAASYLGACHRPEAIPYLVKALRHTAWRTDAKTAEYLRALTGMDFGTDFTQWQQWWLARHPDSSFDWTSSLGHAPRLAANSKQ